MDAKLSLALRFGAAYTGTVFVSMTNIFDRYYAKARSYMGGHTGDYPMPPREIFGGMSVQF